MSAEADHVLLTRFNLPSAGVESLVRAQEGWLRTRVELFERYCVPSVLAQTSSNYRWLIYFDPESPQWLKDRVEVHAKAGTFHPVFRESVDRTELLCDIAHLFPTPSKFLITTNLDNDDGLAVDFVERLQSVSTRERTAIFLTRGLIKSPMGLYRRVDRYNAFCSVREPWQGAVTCWLTWHNGLQRRMPTRTLSGAPAWLQVVHGTNVSNRVHGALTTAEGNERLFPGLLDGVPPVSRARLARDTLIERPLRTVRDGARMLLKAPARVLLSPEGFERAKMLLASLRRAAP
jgi:hypothetical protein